RTNLRMWPSRPDSLKQVRPVAPSGVQLTLQFEQVEDGLIRKQAGCRLFWSTRAAVLPPVTGTTERDQVFLGVVSLTTSKYNVMKLQIRHRSAVLTAPVIPLQHLSTEFAILIPR